VSRKREVAEGERNFSCEFLTKLLDDWVKSATSFAFKVEELDEGHCAFPGIIENMGVRSHGREAW
jgi:hypothetical protein